MTDQTKPDTWREFVAANGIVDPITDEHVERFAERLWAQFNKRIAGLTGAMQTINAIRNSIIGAQTVNWSEHVYPLISALDGAGYRGLVYEEARASVRTTLERIAELEAEMKGASSAANNAYEYNKLLEATIDNLRSELKATQAAAWEQVYTGTVKEQSERIAELEAEANLLQHRLDAVRRAAEQDPCHCDLDPETSNGKHVEECLWNNVLCALEINDGSDEPETRAERVTELELELAELQRRAPQLVNGAQSEAGDCDIICSVCGVPTEEPHAAAQCFAMVVDAEKFATDDQEHRIIDLETENEQLRENTAALSRAIASYGSISDEVEQLKARLSRGVFVRELSGPTFQRIWGAHFDAGNGVFDHQPYGEACIAEATKLPDGAVRWTGTVRVAEVGDARAVSVANGIAEMDLPAGSSGVLHIVFVPEGE
jgi:hypothetical protein